MRSDPLGMPYLKPKLVTETTSPGSASFSGAGEVLITAVVAVYVFQRLARSRQPLQRERINEKLRDPVAAAHQADELSFGGCQRRVGHHVEEANMQLTDVLVHRAVQAQHFVPVLAQA